MLHPEPERQSEVGGKLPVVMRIDAHAPQRDRNVAGNVQRLSVLITQAVDEFLHPTRYVTEVHGRVVVVEVVIADVVAAVVLAELESMFSLYLCKVVDELILGDIAAL